MGNAHGVGVGVWIGARVGGGDGSVVGCGVEVGIGAGTGRVGGTGRSLWCGSGGRRRGWSRCRLRLAYSQEYERQYPRQQQKLRQSRHRPQKFHSSNAPPIPHTQVLPNWYAFLSVLILLSHNAEHNVRRMIGVVVDGVQRNAGMRVSPQGLSRVGVHVKAGEVGAGHVQSYAVPLGKHVRRGVQHYRHRVDLARVHRRWPLP